MKKTLFLFFIAFFITNAYSMTKEERRYLSNYSDTMQFLPSVYALGLLLYYDDSDQLYNYFGSMALNVASTQSIKAITQRKRPDYMPGDRKDSFPSGHTSFAFHGAFFANSRYGLEFAIPAYVIATSVGISRVALKRHHVTDVLAGVAFAYAANYFTVKTRINKTQVSITPLLDYDINKTNIALIAKF